VIRKKLAPPKTQRKFTTPWGELDYLCQKINYWLHIQAHKPRAERYLDRLQRVLRELPENDMAIVREEGFALLYELKGKAGEAIAHRRREIELMERLHREAQSPRYDDSTRAYMLRRRDATALRRRRAILEALTKAKAQRTMARSGSRNERNSPSGQ
jgi:hypothetical protein